MHEFLRTYLSCLIKKSHGYIRDNINYVQSISGKYFSTQIKMGQVVMYRVFSSRNWLHGFKNLISGLDCPPLIPILIPDQMIHGLIWPSSVKYYIEFSRIGRS